jgi:hypothetical protein
VTPRGHFQKFDPARIRLTLRQRNAGAGRVATARNVALTPGKILLGGCRNQPRPFDHTVRRPRRKLDFPQRNDYI